MRIGLLSCLAVGVYPVPVTAQTDPLVVARAFVQAMQAGDTAALRSRHTQDALFIGGDVGIPLTGVESAFAQPKFKPCTISSLFLRPEKVPADVLGDQTPASIRDGSGRKVEGTLSCPAETGGIRRTAVAFIFAGDQIAIFALG